MIKATIKIGEMDITFEAQNMKDVFKFSGVYGNLPKECHNCKGQELMLDHRSPQNYDYYSLKCTTCGSSANFGQAKEGGALFWKYDNELTPYVAPPTTNDQVNERQLGTGQVNIENPSPF